MSFIARVRRRIELRPGTDFAGTVDRVTANSSLTPENVWMLACSAVLASIGLDVNSAAVVIGAMLVSPLMGPIMGVGLGMGVTNRPLLQRALAELALATLVSLGVSAAYFLVSPFAAPTTELVARIRPTLLDVGVAFFGGIAGIVAGSRKQHGLALPGVAIATALMPPLCTAGFGLATGRWSFLFGALYLYGINAIFISLSAFIIVRVLGFPHHTEVTPAERRRERRLVAAVAAVAILPSIYFLYESSQTLRQNQRIRDFVAREINAPGRTAQQWERTSTNGGTALKVYIAGHPVDPIAADSLTTALERYGLSGVRLELVQSDISSKDFENFQGAVQRDILRAIAIASASRDSAALARQRGDSSRFASIAQEVSRVFPEIEGMMYAPRLNLLSSDTTQMVPAFILRFARATRNSERRSIVARTTALLRSRLNDPRVLVVEQ